MALWITKISNLAFAAVLATSFGCSRPMSSTGSHHGQTAAPTEPRRSHVAPRLQGEQDAAADIAAARWRYFHVGQPLRDTSPYIRILASRYQVTLEQEGCGPVPPRAEYVKAYNDRMLRALTERFGFDPLRAAADDAAKEGGF